MDTRFTDEQLALRDRIAKFAQEVLAPEAERIDREGFDMDHYRKVMDAGLVAVPLPKEVGGEGMGTVGRCILLEEVSKVQQTQLEAMRGKQLEAQQIIDGLGQEVKDLIAKRDAELLAAQQEAERARKEREEAERAAAAAKEWEQAAAAATASDASATTGANTTATSSDGASQASGKGSAAKVVAACQSTPSPGLGLCAGWCSNVMINAGYGFVPGNANDMYANYCHSSNRADLKPGMAVAVSTHPHTSAGRIYGHIGMYIGNGTMMDNIGYIRTISVDEWCSFYGATVTPRWGWLNNIVLE